MGIANPVRNEIMDCKLSIDLLPRQLGICSPEHFYGAGLNLELVLCVQSLVCGTGDCAQGLVKARQTFYH